MLSGDGTGQFHSNKISCPSCYQKKSRDRSISYYHQMFGVCLVHPKQKNVIPLCPEPILKEDGLEKNDCERNACKRFLKHFRQEHPHLKAIFLADGMSRQTKWRRLTGLKALLAHEDVYANLLWELYCRTKVVSHQQSVY